MRISTRTLLPALILGLGALGAAILLAGPPPPQPAAAVSEQPVSVDYLLLQPQLTAVQLRVFGSVAPRRSVALAAEVAGKITSVASHYRRGGELTEGEILLEIDSLEYRSARATAAAKLADAQAQLASERGRAEQAEQQWQELGSEQANQLFLRKPQLRKAEAAEQAARAELALAERNVQRCTVRAPFQARLHSVAADLGEYVAKGATLATLYDTSSLEVALPLSSQQLAQLNLAPAALAKGLSIRLRSSDDGSEHPATIRRRAAAVDADSRLFSVYADIGSGDAAAPALAVGQFVEAIIPSNQQQLALAVPSSALYQQRFLRLIDSNNRLQLQPVTTLFSDGDIVYVAAPSDAPVKLVVSSLANNRANRLLAPRQLPAPGSQREPQLASQEQRP